jgi:hypothetical protein
MGAILIRDGFNEYVRLALANEIFGHLKDSDTLMRHVDRQFVSEIDYYSQQLSVFLAILEDLGLKTILNKTRQFSRKTDEEIMTLLDDDDDIITLASME